MVPKHYPNKNRQIPQGFRDLPSCKHLITRTMTGIPALLGNTSFVYGNNEG
jgi:hypothetical protein